jgi:hypothetical protein
MIAKTLIPQDEFSHEELLAHAIHWTWSCKLQIVRYSEALQRELDSKGIDQLERKKRCSETSLQEHMILVAARNLLRALNMLSKVHSHLNLPRKLRGDLRQLRDIYEHWDEQIPCFRGGRSATSKSGGEFLSRNPLGRPFSVQFTKQGPIMAGVVTLRTFVRELDQLEKKLLRIESSV